MPDVLISDDGRLVALQLDDGQVAINRSRPSSFTMENWQRVLQAEDVAKPGTLPFPNMAEGNRNKRISSATAVSVSPATAPA